MAKLDSRLELRLDRRTYEQLERRAAADQLSVAELVRKAIARELGSDERSWRQQALERGLNLDVPIPEDPVDLVRELEAGYDAEANVSPAPATGD
jgi:transposase-like protein